MSNMYEIFMPIKDYEDTYAVSNLGRVKNIKTGKILKQWKKDTGYMCIGLAKNGKTKTYLVHRLVLETFKANPNNKPQVNHINEDKTDNRLNNLEWATPKENANHGTRNARIVTTHKANGTYKKAGKVTSDKLSIPVYCITNNTVYKSACEAARQLNLNKGNVDSCCKGKFKQTGGYQFKYYTEGDVQ